MDQNTPLTTLRDGRLKMTVWENTDDKGVHYHTVTPAKTYEDRNGKLQDSHSFSAGELLRLAELSREAHGVIRDVRRDAVLDRQSERNAPSQGEQPHRFQNRNGPGMER